jgi:hypothetical protein
VLRAAALAIDVLEAQREARAEPARDEPAGPDVVGAKRPCSRGAAVMTIAGSRG